MYWIINNFLIILVDISVLGYILCLWTYTINNHEIYIIQKLCTEKYHKGGHVDWIVPLQNSYDLMWFSSQMWEKEISLVTNLQINVLDSF